MSYCRIVVWLCGNLLLVLMDILIQHHLGDTSDEVLLREAIDAKSFLSVFSIAKEKQCFTYQGVSQETRPWQPVSVTHLAIE